MTEHACAKRVPDVRRATTHPCTRQGKVRQDGEWWCRQHSPSSVRARAEGAAARYEAQIDVITKPYRVLVALEEEIAALRTANAELLAALEAAREAVDESKED